MHRLQVDPSFNDRPKFARNWTTASPCFWPVSTPWRRRPRSTRAGEPRAPELPPARGYPLRVPGLRPSRRRHRAAVNSALPSRPPESRRRVRLTSLGVRRQPFGVREVFARRPAIVWRRPDVRIPSGDDSVLTPGPARSGWSANDAPSFSPAHRFGRTRVDRDRTGRGCDRFQPADPADSFRRVLPLSRPRRRGARGEAPARSTRGDFPDAQRSHRRHPGPSGNKRTLPADHEPGGGRDHAAAQGKAATVPG